MPLSNTFRYKKACIRKFILYLEDNGHIACDDSIRNDDLVTHFAAFRKEHKLGIWYSDIRPLLRQYFTGNGTQSNLVFREIKLDNVLNNPEVVDAKFKELTRFVEKKIVSQNVAFKPSKTNKIMKTELFDIKIQNLDIGSLILRKNVKNTLVVQATNISTEILQVDEIYQSADITYASIKANLPITLSQDKTCQFTIVAKPETDGILLYSLFIRVTKSETAILFPVDLYFHVHDEFLDSLHPTTPYKPHKAIYSDLLLSEPTDLGSRPNQDSYIKTLEPLKPYKFPNDLIFILNTGLKDDGKLMAGQRKTLQKTLSILTVENKPFCLTPSNYTSLLDLLLFFEEHAMMKHIRDYDCEDQTVAKLKGSTLYALDVPGLAEQRPSILVGDQVNVKTGKNDTKIYGGFVHKVEETTVHLDFSENFSKLHQNGMKFHVGFTFNRHTLRTEHQAVEITRNDNIATVFFPKSMKAIELPAKISLNWVNKNLEQNREQQEAVYNIINKSAMPYPYLVFGPPGTGKTVTIVEAIKQIHRLTQQKILVCTPSNSAANEITKRLVDSIPTTDLMRFIAVSFPFKQIPSEIVKYTNFKTKIHTQIVGKDFTKYRIIVTTLVNAAKLINYKCPKGHFNYVFIDESGQATESETLIPIAGILSSKNTLQGQIVLAGDPEQLGPVIHSPLAIEYGFGISMLERLMRTIDAYKKNDNKFNPGAVTKLLLNYRSHPEIIRVPNELFYENELQAVGDPSIINLAINSPILSNKNIPIIFHHIVGKDKRESNSPSFFNIEEISVVLSYLERLIDSKMCGRKILAKDIGIITPYRKQVQKLSQAIKKKNISADLTVGTVEQFQGQERLIMIISTVRSTPEKLQFDNKFHLGFVKNRKRFNVAITRAKALLIVVGNGDILQGDENWRRFLKYNIDNGTLGGSPFALKEQIDANLANGLAQLESNDETNTVDGPNFSRGHN